jgi:preprotein translocase subunit SecF
MKLFNDNSTMNFMKYRKVAVIASATLLCISLISLGIQTLNFGIDFTGGTLIHVIYPEAADLEKVRGTLSEAGFDNAIAKNYGTSVDVEIRIPPQDKVDRTQVAGLVREALQKAEPSVEVVRVDFVGPQVGEELAEQGTLAMLYVLIGILLYVAMRFQFKFSLGAVLALIHDVIITLGIFSIFQFDFDLSVMAALLAVIGYSLNDTIVVYDRIRENFRKIRKSGPIEVINISLNETFGRTMMTSITTLIVLLALFFLGGTAISYFALALIIGVVVGTYSSVFVASTTILAMGVTKQDLVIPEKEGSEDGSQV